VVAVMAVILLAEILQQVETVQGEKSLFIIDDLLSYSKKLSFDSGVGIFTI